MEVEEGRAEQRRPNVGEQGALGSVPSYGGLDTSQPISEASDSSVDEPQPFLGRRTSSHLIDMTPLRSMQHSMPLPPEDSVYSYLMYIAPIEHRREKRYITSLTFFAAVLVVVNFIMQAGLLYVVGQHIMNKHVQWVSSVSTLKNHAWYHVFPMAYNQPPPKCIGKVTRPDAAMKKLLEGGDVDVENMKKYEPTVGEGASDSPLCFQHGKGISCSPLSIHVLMDWARLDSDGDGIWAREEAEDEILREKVQCEYNVDLPSLYNDMMIQINGSDALQGRRDTNLFTGAGVHKAYLNWYLHKPLLCQYGDQDMCGSLFERGFFDEALRRKPSIEFKDTKSALKYCQHILQYECVDILPNTYTVWRNVANQQCGDKVFGQSLYKSPSDGGVAIPMLNVDFKNRIDYASTKTFAFRIFLCILLVTFLSVMAHEMRSIVKSFLWCALFPEDKEVDRVEGGLRPRLVSRQSVVIERGTSANDVLSGFGDAKKSIHAVRRDHRCVMLLVTILRSLLWCFLLWSGIMFLTGPPRYLTLIFDALSLLFIFEIDELLYKTMLRTEFKEDHDKIEDMQVPQWHGGRISGKTSVSIDMASFFFVIGFGCLIVFTYTQNELNPLLESLECLCSVQGSQCFEANQYSKTWWDTYWATTLPASNTIIDQLKAI